MNENKVISEKSKNNSLEETMVELAKKVNNEYREQHSSVGINIDEISKTNDFNPNEILNEMRKRNPNYIDSLSEEDKIDLVHAMAKSNYDYFTRERKNFSEESNQIMEKIKRGHIPDDREFRTIISDEQWLKENLDRLNDINKLNEIKRRVSDGKIDINDFNELSGIIGFDEEISNLLRQEFASREILAENYENSNELKSKSI